MICLDRRPSDQVARKSDVRDGKGVKDSMHLGRMFFVRSKVQSIEPRVILEVCRRYAAMPGTEQFRSFYLNSLKESRLLAQVCTCSLC
jgi:hypothetical protein